MKEIIDQITLDVCVCVWNFFLAAMRYTYGYFHSNDDDGDDHHHHDGGSLFYQ